MGSGGTGIRRPLVGSLQLDYFGSTAGKYHVTQIESVPAFLSGIGRRF